MKLVLEMIDGVMYACRESKKHHKTINRSPENRIEPEHLDNECNLDSFPDGSYMVFNIK